MLDPQDGQTYPIESDTIIGDGGNVTVYERPDQSRYALDKKGNGSEWGTSDPIFGRARFDSREQATGSWRGSRSTARIGTESARTTAIRRARPHAGGRAR
ncbi:MAG: hypothetical protein H0W09_08325 [Solirubrobacterales bacterium]|nr:hypothetical protein [Solirubrobacterales bacterium]